MPKYKLPLGSVPQELTGGKLVEPGQTVNLSSKDLEDDHNKLLVESGVLISADEKGGDNK